jgi:hypothetical protein
LFKLAAFLLEGFFFVPRDKEEEIMTIKASVLSRAPAECGSEAGRE